jgi:hypothetical protein
VADDETTEITLKLYALAADDGHVRADVFLSELRTVLRALWLSDEAQNKRFAHDYLIVGLEIGSAVARLRERILPIRLKRRREFVSPARASSIRYVREVITSVYNGERDIERFPKTLVRDIGRLAKNAGSTFAHGELGFGEDNVIRIDDYLLRQADRAILRLSGEKIPEKYFTGISFSTFDGILKEVDARGTLVRGKFILTTGEKEIDCVFRSGDIGQVRETFDMRARVEAIAHYDGDSPLPTRLDIKRLVPVKPTADLTHWEGAFSRTPDEAEDDY